MLQGTNDQRPNLTLSFLTTVALTVLLNVPALRATVLSIPSSSCFACDGQAEAFSTFAGTSTFSWFTVDGDLMFTEATAAGNSTAIGLCTGVYHVQWNNGTEAASAWFSIGLPGADAGDLVNISICTGTGNNNLYNRLEGSPTPGGQWTNPLGMPHSGIFNPNTGVPGLYTYSVNVGGCELTSGVAITLIQNADAGLSTTYLICETYDPFFLTDVLAGTPDYGGQWFNGQQQPIDGFYNPQVDDTQLFTYMVSIPGCPAVFSTMFVIENQLPNPGISTSVAVCPNAVPFVMTEVMDGNPQTTGTWTTSMNVPVGPVFDPDVLGPGTYTYVVQGQTPCPSQEATITISFTDGIFAGEPQALPLCTTDAPVSLFDALMGQVSAGGVWTGPQGNVVDALIDPTTVQVGTYTYSVDAVGCQPVSASVPVTVEQAVSAGTGGVIEVCENASPIPLNTLYGPDATPGGTWSITGIPINANLVIEGGQDYNLVYSVVANVCPSSQANYTVVAQALPVAGPNQELNLCAINESIDLQAFMAPTGGFTSQWQSPDGTLIGSLLNVSAAQEGDYQYTLFSGNLCPNASAVLTLNLEEPPFQGGMLTEGLCYAGGPVNLSLLAGGLPAGGIWQLNGNTVANPLPESQVASGAYTYEMNGGAICGTTVLVLDLTISVPLSAGEGSVLSVCTTNDPFDASEWLTNASPGGEWFVNGAPSGEVIFDPSAGEDVMFTYVIPAIGPCPGDSSVIEVFVDSGFAYSAGPDYEVCSGDESFQIGINMCPTCTFEWSPSEHLQNTTVATPVFTVPFAAEQQQIVLTVTASSGACSITDEVIVMVNPVPTLFVSGPTSLCMYEEGSWEALGASEITWSVSTTSDTAFASVFAWSSTEDFSLSVTGTNEFGCSTVAEWSVNVLEVPEVIVDIPPAGGCSPQTFLLELPQSDDGVSYYYTFNGQEYFADAEVTIVQPGVYDVILTGVNASGCASSFELDAVFEVFPVPLPSFDVDASELSVHSTGVRFDNTTQTPATFEWDFGGQGSSSEFSPWFEFPPLADQGYRICLEAVNSDGCSDVFCRDVYIPGELIVYVPTAFTPDGDGVNEAFRPFVTGFKDGSYTFSIFNRWGERIFQSDNPSEYWYGNVKGNQFFAQNDVYVWVLEVADAYSADKRRFTGHVTLIR